MLHRCVQSMFGFSKIPVVLLKLYTYAFVYYMASKKVSINDILRSPYYIPNKTVIYIKPYINQLTIWTTK